MIIIFHYHYLNLYPVITIICVITNGVITNIIIIRIIISSLSKVLVIVMAVILFLLLITSLSFTLSARWQSKNAQHR